MLTKIVFEFVQPCGTGREIGEPKEMKKHPGTSVVTSTLFFCFFWVTETPHCAQMAQHPGYIVQQAAATGAGTLNAALTYDAELEKADSPRQWTQNFVQTWVCGLIKNIFLIGSSDCLFICHMFVTFLCFSSLNDRQGTMTEVEFQGMSPELQSYHWINFCARVKVDLMKAQVMELRQQVQTLQAQQQQQQPSGFSLGGGSPSAGKFSFGGAAAVGGSTFGGVGGSTFGGVGGNMFGGGGSGGGGFAAAAPAGNKFSFSAAPAVAGFGSGGAGQFGFGGDAEAAGSGQGGDTPYQCMGCGGTFYYHAAFYQQKGWDGPKRCKACKDAGGKGKRR